MVPRSTILSILAAIMSAAPASAAAAPRTVVGLGEVLWDVLPSTRLLGGAPTNMCYHARCLGDRGVVASRIGDDELGREAVSILEARGVDTSYVQVSPARPTSRVLVALSADGHATYEIERGSAWDELELSEQWRELARRADAVCFGSLAQRSAPSREAISGFLAATRPDCVRIFDVNLRQDFYSHEVLSSGLGLAQICKLNDEEAQPLLDALGLQPGGAPGAAATPTRGQPCPRELEVAADLLLAAFPGLGLVCITRGGEGVLLASRAARVSEAAVKAAVVDTIGAGDAFTAALARAVLAEPAAPAELGAQALASAAAFASKYAAHVCSSAGGMPEPPAWLGADEHTRLRL